jgi:putative transposase
MLCRVLGVSRSGFYEYLRRQDRDPDPEHEEKLELVKKIAEASGHTYGSRRMAKALQALGYRVGRHQARTLMREAGVWVRYRRRYRVTTESNHRKAVFPNRLQRDFAPSAPNRVWAGDITCPSGPRKGGCTWRWSSTCSRAKCSVGRWGGA